MKLGERIAPVEQRLQDQSILVDGHLLWGGTLDGDGYGRLHVEGKTPPVHRTVWEIVYGPIPPGIQVNHLCDTPPCIEPEHLYLGTQSDNMYDRVRAGRHANSNKTHCPAGHPYSESNTYNRPRGGRECRACIKDRR